MKWSVGDKVRAKWPGSALYFQAEIKSIADDTAEVLFEDGTEMEIPIKTIMSEKMFVPRKRSRSPARSRRRSKSPSRSPSRKSTTLRKKSPSKRTSSLRENTAVVESTTYENIDKKAVITSTDGIIETTSHVTNVEFKSTADINSEYMITRLRKKQSGLTSELKKDILKAINKKPPLRCSAVLGVMVVYITAPLLTLFLLLVGSEADWCLSKMKLSMIPRNFKDYFDPTALLYVASFLVFQAVLFALPLGRVVKGSVLADEKRLEYRISARYALFITLLVYGALCFYKVPITTLHDKLFQLAVAATLITFIGNTFFYLLSFDLPEDKLNPQAMTGSHIYDSFMGRIFNPRFGKLFDIKFFLYRPAMIGWMLLIWVEIHREYGKISNQFLLVAVSQMIYVWMEIFFDEEQCPFMFDIKNEGLGFVAFLGELVIVPFVYSMPVRYVTVHPTQYSTSFLIAFAFLFFIGMTFVALPGRQKGRFRKNPFDHTQSYLESLPPSKSHGERLIVSGLWGVLRHPNYLGEILIAIFWSLACGSKHAIAWFYPVFVTGLVIHRSIRVDEESEKKHGEAWKRYCERVQYRVIPGIF